VCANGISAANNVLTCAIENLPSCMGSSSFVSCLTSACGSQIAACFALSCTPM
jgi:hypothetical protein